MRKGTLAAALGVLAVVCSACSGSSRSSAVGHPGTASLGPGGTASGSVSSSPATAPAAPEPVAAGPGASWTVYHGNGEATGVQAAPVRLLPSRRAWTSPVLDGQLYGEPLVADGRIVAATENDTVYVMAARSGRILWSRHLADPVPSGDLPCGDISPVVGITGTPVIDLARHEIFVDADTLIKGPSASGGAEASHREAEIAGIEPRTASMSSRATSARTRPRPTPRPAGRHGRNFSGDPSYLTRREQSCLQRWQPATALITR